MASGGGASRGRGQAGGPADDAAAVLDQLNRLLLRPAEQRIDAIEAHLRSDDELARDVGRVLPAAARSRPEGDTALGQALVPAVEQALQLSLFRNPRTLTDLVYPILGPAIRRAVAAALTGMVDSLNRVLENSLSLRSVRWRLEALRSGRPFAEVALAHSLVYRVEQLFLIHGDSGLLLHHLVAPGVPVQDPGLVSAMLTAITDFVRDSFGGRGGESLETLTVGEHTVWVEPGSSAVLAAVIRGRPPAELRPRLQEALEAIHARFAEPLESFAGDAAPFAAAADDLDGCLRAEYQAAAGRSPLLWLVPALALLALALWGAHGWRDGRRFAAAVARLGASPGIVVTAAERRGGGWHVRGLRDPLAPDPALVLAAAGADPARLDARFEPYLSLAPELAAARARAALAPPATVTLELRGDRLEASGRARHRWLADAALLGRSLPGLAGVDLEAVVDVDGEEMDALARRVAARRIAFAVGASAWAEEEEPVLDLAAAELRRLGELGALTGRPLRIQVLAATDEAGTDELNRRLRRERAERVVAALTGRGVAPGLLEPASADRASRQVTFRVVAGAGEGR